MTASLLHAGILRWILQIGTIVLIGAAVPRVLPLRLPNVRLAFWQIVLLSCLILTAIRSWKQAVMMENVSISTTIVAIVSHPAARCSPVLPIALLLLVAMAAGALVRLGFLISGLLRLRRYRLESTPLEPAPSWAVEADVRVSREVSGPVTCGFRKPVILLPRNPSRPPPRLALHSSRGNCARRFLVPSRDLVAAS